MAIKRLSVDEVCTAIGTLNTRTAISTSPNTATGTGTQTMSYLRNVAFLPGATPSISFSYDVGLQYSYMLMGNTFYDFAVTTGLNGSVTLPAGSTVPCTGASILSSISCDPASMTFSSSEISGTVAALFTVTNLITPTIICVDDTTCP